MESYCFHTREQKMCTSSQCVRKHPTKIYPHDHLIKRKIFDLKVFKHKSALNQTCIVRGFFDSQMDVKRRSEKRNIDESIPKL